MEQTKVSSKYQVVIPKSVRERVSLKPGQMLTVIVKGNVISLVPLPSLADLRGIAAGANTENLREEGDRL